MTRDLYIDRTAEALGVSVESVRREASGRGAVRTRPAHEAAPEQEYDVDLHRRLPERDLLRVMLHAPEWRSRIREALPDVDILPKPEGDLLMLVADADESMPLTDLMLQVAGAGRLALAELIEQGLGEQNVDAIVVGALGLIESRRLADKKRAVSRQITVAAEDEKVKLLEEKVALNRESRKLNTREWNVLRRGGDSGAG